MKLHNIARAAGVTGFALVAMAGAALADGYEGGSAKDAPVAEGRKLTWSVTLGATSDYVFRGLSLNDEKPAAQGSVDLSYGIFYAGVWSSNLDDATGLGPAEIDVYAGFKPVVGPVTFDFGIIGYLYPGSSTSKRDAAGLVGNDEYLELKAGGSITPFTNATLGLTAYYSPESQYTDNNDSLAIEGTAGYTFHQVGIFVPTVSGTFGWQYIEDQDFGGGNDDDYLYWNVGLALAVDKFTIDLRYWDTDIASDATYISEGLADERFVASVKVTLP